MMPPTTSHKMMPISYSPWTIAPFGWADLFNGEVGVTFPFALDKEESRRTSCPAALLCDPSLLKRLISISAAVRRGTCNIGCASRAGHACPNGRRLAASPQIPRQRSAERHVGEECVRKFRSQGATNQ